MGKPDVAHVRTVNAILADLREIKQKCMPEDDDSKGREEMGSWDDYQRKKHDLNFMLKPLRENIAKLNEMRKALGTEARTPDMMRKENQNNADIKQALAVWEELKKFLLKEEKKKKPSIDPGEMVARKKETEILGKEIMALSTSNARVKMVRTQAEVEMAERAKQRVDHKRQEREERQRVRKEKIKQRGKVAPDDDDEAKGLKFDEDDMRSTVVDGKEQQFYDQVQANVYEQDEILKEILKGLEDLENMSKDIGAQLNVQAEMTTELNEQMDRTNKTLETRNRRLKEMMDKSGATGRWCPTVVCLILLLALAGYIVTLVV